MQGGKGNAGSKMSKGHTKGPWRRNKKHPRSIVAGSRGRLGIAEVSIFRDEWEANGDLIAAATDLLAEIQRRRAKVACKVYGIHVVEEDPFAELTRLNALIKLATEGES